MSKQIKIKSFDELINFIETQNVSTKDICNIISNTIGVYIFFTSHDDKSILIRDLKNYWSEYKNLPITDRPIFLIG